MRLFIFSVLLAFSPALFSQSTTDSLAVVVQDTTVEIAVSMLPITVTDTAEAAIRRKPFAFITNIPSDLWQMAKAPFKKENLTGLIVTAAATALTIPFDQQILDGTRDLLDRVNLQQEAQYITPIKIGSAKLLKLPKNVTGGFYMIGEGSISMAIAGGLYLYGKIDKDQRAVHTAADLTETFFTMGISTQILKRISGRQSPSFATTKGGKWHPFPSFKEYQNNTTNYDAYPSGHLATMMATVTTLALNYPDNKWIKPVGYSLIGLTGLAMVNTKVHWVGDYPLALALGYISAKITYLRNHPAPKKQIYL